MSDYRPEWEKSYERRENFVFYPSEELVRFCSKYVRKRVGLNEFRDVKPWGGPIRFLDLGCGIGRHVVMGQQMGFEVYGIDFSHVAIETARKWGREAGTPDVEERIVQGSVEKLPWGDGFFDVVVSFGVLDSMRWDVARAGVKEAARVLKRGGLFYADLVSPDDSNHGREFDGEEIVQTTHEQGTVQSYFNYAKIQRLVEGQFEIVEALVTRREDLLKHWINARNNVTFRKLG